MTQDDGGGGVGLNMTSLFYMISGREHFKQFGINCTWLQDVHVCPPNQKRTLHSAASNAAAGGTSSLKQRDNYVVSVLICL